MPKNISESFFSAHVRMSWVLSLCAALLGQGVVLYSKVHTLEADVVLTRASVNRDIDTVRARNVLQDAMDINLQTQLNHVSGCPR